ncbi:MAG: hypothetical protein A2Y38_13300 [Spirochaetes bacterium GWB1_59_5]|nr:MAG: hypothetical protein A2Y38_13300 [Spirochaetes bacterium GWB1_59_5]
MPETVGAMTSGILAGLSGGKIPLADYQWALNANPNRRKLARLCQLLEAERTHSGGLLDAVEDHWLQESSRELFGDEDGARIYTLWNLYSTEGARRWAENTRRVVAADGLRIWCRAAIGLLVFASAWGPGRYIRDHKRPRALGPLFGDGAVNGEFNPFSVLCGARSYSRLDADEAKPENVGKFHHLDTNVLDLPLIHAGIWTEGNVNPKSWEDKVWKAMVKRWPSATPFGLTAEEIQVARRAIHNDLGAIRQVVEWLKAAPRPHWPFTIARGDRYVWMLAREVGDGSTGSLNFCSWEITFFTQFLSALNGMRKSKAPPGQVDDDVDATRGWVDVATRRAVCRRVDGKTGELSAKLPEGELLCTLNWAPDDVSLIVHGEEEPGPGPDPLPVPAPKPPKVHRWTDWL